MVALYVEDVTRGYSTSAEASGVAAVPYPHPPPRDPVGIGPRKRSIYGHISNLRLSTDRWADIWALTPLSAARLFGDVFDRHNMEVTAHGNGLTSIAFPRGPGDPRAPTGGAGR
jgi:hypothetical protein